MRFASKRENVLCRGHQSNGQWFLEIVMTPWQKRNITMVRNEALFMYKVGNKHIWNHQGDEVLTVENISVTLRRIRDRQEPLFANNLSYKYFHQCSWFPSPYKPTDASEKHNLCLHQCSNHYLTHHGWINPIPNCHTTLSTPKNASGPKTLLETVTRVSFLSLLSSPQSHHLHCLPLEDEGGLKVTFSPNLKCQSQSSVSKISKVSSSQGD